MSAPDGPFTTGDIARRYGCRTWQVRRLFEEGRLPPAKRIGLYRVFFADDLPAVERALRDAGLLTLEPAGACA